MRSLIIIRKDAFFHGSVTVQSFYFSLKGALTRGRSPHECEKRIIISVNGAAQEDHITDIASTAYVYTQADFLIYRKHCLRTSTDKK